MNRNPAGFAPRDGSGAAGVSASVGHGVGTSEAGGVRMAAGPPPPAPAADTGGLLGLGGSGRWERERESSKATDVSKRKVG